MLGRSIQDQKDRESDLIYFLLTISSQSKYRRPGTNGILGGCTDRIMTFDQDRIHHDSARQFFGYLNRMLRNQFFTLETRAQSNPTTRRGTLQITTDDDGFQRADCYVSEGTLSALHQQFSGSCESPAQYALVSKFLAFVRAHNRELISVLESITSCSSYLEAQDELGLDNRAFSRARRRLKFSTAASVQVIPSPDNGAYTDLGRAFLGLLECFN
jgi:hypothetical protein